MSLFRIVNSTPPVIQCVRCLEETRYWDDRQAGRWKVAHANGCPADPMTLVNTLRSSK